MTQEKNEKFIKRERMNAQRVMAMFRQNAVIELRVMNYHELPEELKDYVCKNLREVILCKMPDRTGKDMMFYLSTELAYMGELFNMVCQEVVYAGFCKAEILLVCRPNSYHVLPNVTKSLHVGKEACV